MNTVFINCEHNKTSKSHVLILKLTNKLKLRRGEIKISAPTWNDKFELSDRSYSISDIQYFFEYI